MAVQNILFCLHDSWQYIPGMLSILRKVNFNHLPPTKWRCKILLLPKKMRRLWDRVMKNLFLQCLRTLLVFSAQFHSRTQWERNPTDKLRGSENHKTDLFCWPSKIVFKCIQNNFGKAKTYRVTSSLHYYGGFVEHPRLINILTSRNCSHQQSLIVVHSWRLCGYL